MSQPKKKKPLAKGRAKIDEDKVSAIKKQLDRLLSSKKFNATPAQKDLLRYVVEKSIAGETDEIKAYNIATQVFNRKADFNQTLDPIVSVQACRLRGALKDYYLGAGKSDPLRIEIPVGAYAPTFRRQPVTSRKAKKPKEQASVETVKGGWPSVLVSPFENHTGDTQLNYMAAGLTTELAMELSRYQDFRVLRQPSGAQSEAISKKTTDYVIEGSLRKDSARFKISAQLFDKSTGVQLWAGSQYHLISGKDLMAFEEETARIVAAHIAGEHGVISLRLAHETRSKAPDELQSYEAILRYYEFGLSLCPKTYLAASEALERAALIEKDCDQVCSMLARLYAVNYSHEIFPQPEGMKEAMRLAQKAVMLNPENQRARAILAYCLILSDDISAANAEVDRALALNPQSLFFMDTIGYLMVLCGKFDEGVELVKKAMSLNPYYSLQAHDALCYYWVRQEDYEKAYEETTNFRRPSNFWEPLLKAALLGLLGRIDEGKEAANELLRLKPNFRERGLVFMKRYVKFEEILYELVSGLNKVGLKIEQPI